MVLNPFPIPRPSALFLEGIWSLWGAEPRALSGKKTSLLSGLEDCSILRWLLQKEQLSVPSCPCGGLEHDCPWDLGQLMGVGWLIWILQLALPLLLSGWCPCWTKSSVL